MKYLTTSGNAQIAYDRIGNGPPVLWIQGCGVQGNGWMPQLDFFANRYTCIWFDNRGMGMSSIPSEKLTVSQMAEDACQVMRAAGIESAHIVGHSLGGLIALQIALQARNMVQSLGLLCTFSGGRYAAPLTPRMVWLGLRTQIGTLRMRRMGFLRLVTQPGRLPNAESLANQMGQLFGHDLAIQPPIVKAQLAAMHETDLTPRLAEIADVPCLILNSEHDPIAPSSAGQVLHKGIVGSKFVNLSDASHAAPITHTAQVNAYLEHHLAAASHGRAITHEMSASSDSVA